MLQSTMGTVPGPNYADIQGLIVRGYTHPFSVHMLFKFTTAKGAGNFFKPLLDHIRSAEHWVSKPDMMLNIGLTWGGINKVRGDLDRYSFPPEFVAGPEGPGPQSSLCDIGGPGDPSTWWNGKFKTKEIDCVIHVYALNEKALTAITEIVAGAANATNGDVTELFPMSSASGRLEQYPYLLNDTIHFGYRDSINQPALNPDQKPAEPTQEDLNNFLVGYNTSCLPYPTTGDEGLFALNGCYNAFRVLHQDVPLFEEFLDEHAPEVVKQTGKPLADAKEWLMAKLNGRWRNGSPMVLTPDLPDPENATETKVSYKQDESGGRCPFAAHTRVANPRDEPITNPPPPHLIRRGVAYGAPMNDTNRNEERGLIGLFLCGNIAAQFQKVYGWINSVDFSDLVPYPPPQDALIANRAQAGQMQLTSFTIPLETVKSTAAEHAPIVIEELPQFVVTRGTAYFLLPGIATLRAIAGNPIS